MRIQIERCWSGGDRFTFRLTLPDGAREYVRGEVWNQETATEALNLLERVYGLARRSVRFVH